MGTLSKHLNWYEVMKSNTATRLGIPNEPTKEHKINLIRIAEFVFEPLREHFGVPIGISSGYRSKALNEAIGGSKTSQHSKGQAIDIDADIFGKITNRMIFNYIKDNLTFDQLIWEFGDDNEPNWIHVSLKKTGNRGQMLRAVKQNGFTKYIVYNG